MDNFLWGTSMKKSPTLFEKMNRLRISICKIRKKCKPRMSVEKITTLIEQNLSFYLPIEGMRISTAPRWRNFDDAHMYDATVKEVEWFYEHKMGRTLKMDADEYEAEEKEMLLAIMRKNREEIRELLISQGKIFAANLDDDDEFPPL